MGHRHGAGDRPSASRPRAFHRRAALLGERLWRPPSPKGYPDDEGSWIDGMARRLDVASNFAERLSGKVDPAGGHRDRPRSFGIERGEAIGGPSREPPAGARAAVHVGRIPEEVSMTFRHHAPSRRQALLGAGALFAWASCRGWHGPRVAIRACSSSCCAARSMGWQQWRRSATPTGSACAATGRWCSTARHRRCRWIPSSRSIPRCRICTGSTRRSRNDRPRRGDALSRTLAFRRSGRSRERNAAARRQ